MKCHPLRRLLRLAIAITKYMNLEPLLLPTARRHWTVNMHAWLTIVREYNLRSLTKSKDKPCAIGGIAELYQLRTGDQYRARTWRSHLAEELLQKVFHPQATFLTMIKGAKDPTSCSQPSPPSKISCADVVMGFNRWNCNKSPCTDSIALRDRCFGSNRLRRCTRETYCTVHQTCSMSIIW